MNEVKSKTAAENNKQIEFEVEYLTRSHLVKLFSES
jgi:hypothetical protein